MSNRLARALRELADALDQTQEEGTWELVDSSAEAASSEDKVSKEKPPVKEEEKPAPPFPTASTVAYKEDWRHYVIVKHPAGKVGFIEGPGATTWKRIEATLPKKCLAGSGARLKRVEDRQQGLQIWQAAHGTLPMPDLHL